MKERKKKKKEARAPCKDDFKMHVQRRILKLATLSLANILVALGVACHPNFLMVAGIIQFGLLISW